MADEWQRIEAPAEGESVTFRLKSSVPLPSGPVEIEEEGFVIRFKGHLYGWLNRCPHIGSPLDWEPGRFFSDDGRHLVCHTHHALFDPANGSCLDGPSPRGLYPLPVRDLGEQLEVPVHFDGNIDDG